MEENRMIKPVRNLIYIAPISDSDESRGGIIIPDQAKERIDQGIVKYVGPNVKDIEVGQFVIFPNYSGTLIFVEDEEDLVIIMEEKDITAVIQEPTNIIIPGLYFKRKVADNDAHFVGHKSHDEYFQANYTMALRFITDAIKNHPYHKAMKVVPHDAPLIRKDR